MLEWLLLGFKKEENEIISCVNVGVVNIYARGIYGERLLLIVP